jgi:hypothetical protein
MKNGSAAGDWPQHADHTDPAPYGVSPVYEIGAKMLKDCGVVEDWGCGLGWFKKIMSDVNPKVQVIGLDGSPSKYVDKVLDLANYERSPSGVPGIFMRGVLEHNWCWRLILEKACDSFTKKLVLAMYIRPSSDGNVCNLYAERFNHQYVGLQIPIGRIMPIMSERKLTVVRHEYLSDTEFGCETVFEVIR